MLRYDIVFMNKYENVNDLIKEIYKEINILSQNRPYNGSNIPWLTSKRYIELIM
jgi:translation elongation factor EF-Tu-like GTPase